MGSSQWGPCSFTADPGAGIVIVIRFIVISHTTWRTVPKPSKPQPSWRNIWNSFNWPGRDKYYISLSHLQIYLQSSPSAQPYYFYLSKYYLPSLSARWYSESKGPHPAKTSLTGSREKPGACWLPVTNCHLTLLLLNFLVNTLSQPVSQAPRYYRTAVKLLSELSQLASLITESIEDKAGLGLSLYLPINIWWLQSRYNSFIMTTCRHRRFTVVEVVWLCSSPTISSTLSLSHSFLSSYKQGRRGPCADIGLWGRLQIHFSRNTKKKLRAFVYLSCIKTVVLIEEKFVNISDWKV